MSLSTDPSAAEVLARDLAALWRSVIEAGCCGCATPAAVATPKTGSPLLGAQLARLLDVPFVLVNSQAKFSSEKSDPRQWLDLSVMPAAGSTVLLADDSTTGGKKALDAVSRLESAGLSVTDFVVLFEPKLKDARSKLQGKGVRLHSVITT